MLHPKCLTYRVKLRTKLFKEIFKKGKEKKSCFVCYHRCEGETRLVNVQLSFQVCFYKMNGSWVEFWYKIAPLNPRWPCGTIPMLVLHLLAEYHTAQKKLMILVSVWCIQWNAQFGPSYLKWKFMISSRIQNSVLLYNLDYWNGTHFWFIRFAKPCLSLARSSTF